MPTGLLRARDISVDFGGVKALRNVDIELAEGAILGVIGPNGAGKTTLVNVISGFQTPTRGDVEIDGVRLPRHSPAHATRAGIARTFQAARLFGTLTVRENIEVGLCASGHSRRRAAAAAQAILDRTGIDVDGDATAGDLPFGAQRLVGFARALGASPRFLLMDEPAAGLNEVECTHLVEIIRKIPSLFGCGILLIEHNMDIVMQTCSRLHVLDHGTTLASGPTDEVRTNPEVISAYLGVEG